MNTCDIEGAGVTFPSILPGRAVRLPEGPMREIVAQVSRETGVAVADIMGDSRNRNIASARQRAMFIGHERGLSTSQIGAYLSRDHTSVLHGIRREKERRAQ